MKYGAIGIKSPYFAQTVSDWAEAIKSMSEDRFVKRLIGAGTGKLVADGTTTG